jgi:hypothetical protein
MSELKEGESCSMSGPPLAKKPRSPAKGKGRLGDVRAQRRGRKTPAPGGKRPKRAGPLALGGLIVSIAAAWAAAAWRIGLQRSGKVKADRRLLNSALALPLRFTDHALCRMDCRRAAGTPPACKHGLHRQTPSPCSGQA